MEKFSKGIFTCLQQGIKGITYYSKYNYNITINDKGCVMRNKQVITKIMEELDGYIPMRDAAFI